LHLFASGSRGQGGEGAIRPGEPSDLRRLLGPSGVDRWSGIVQFGESTSRNLRSQKEPIGIADQQLWRQIGGPVSPGVGTEVSLNLRKLGFLKAYWQGTGRRTPE
jgi:hypothetical protein